jgi:protocatechuate 3,4-dioxygenase beta subunit
MAANGAFAQAPDTSSKCKLEGQVVNAVTGEPLRKVLLRVERYGPAEPSVAVSNSPSVPLYATQTGPDGHFLLSDLNPGTYTLSARRAGFLSYGNEASSMAFGAAPFKLASGEHRKDIVVKMTPQGFIHGQVLDDDGDPVASAHVRVYRLRTVNGEKLAETVAETDVQGDASFVFGNLPPGRYFLSAQDMEMGLAAAGRKGPVDVYAPTFFPNTSDAESAAPITLTAGSDIRGIDIRLRRARVFHVSGRVINATTGRSGTHLPLMLVSKGPFPSTNATQALGDDGHFRFDSVVPGSYVLQCCSQSVSMVTFKGNGVSYMKSFSMTMPEGGDNASTETLPLIGRLAVGVSGDIDNLVLTVGPGAEIAGTMQLDPAGPLPADVAIRLQPLEGNAFEGLMTQVEGDGAFHMVGVLPAVYKTIFGNLPEDTYVKSVRFVGRDITNGKLDLSAGAGGHMDVTLSRNAAAITGVVRNADGDPAPGAKVQIWMAGGDFVNTVEADENGAFRMSGLAPAEYRAVAWEAIDEDLAGDPSFRARFESQTASVKVAEKARGNVDLKLVGRAAVEDAADKVK